MYTIQINKEGSRAPGEHSYIRFIEGFDIEYKYVAWSDFNYWEGYWKEDGIITIDNIPIQLFDAQYMLSNLKNKEMVWHHLIYFSDEEGKRNLIELDDTLYTIYIRNSKGDIIYTL